MPTIQEAAEEFLARKCIAVAGVSRSSMQPANAIYRKLRKAGYRVYPTNPSADEVEGDRCYPDLKSIPEKPDGVVIATHPDVTARIVGECGELGIPRVWIHRSLGQGSLSDEAVLIGREKDLTVIPGGCPMMFCKPVDFPHRCIRWIAKLTGGLPREV